MAGAALPWSIASSEASPIKCVIKSSNLGQGLSLDSKEAQARESSGKARERLWPSGSKGHIQPLLQTGQRAVQ